MSENWRPGAEGGGFLPRTRRHAWFRGVLRDPEDRVLWRCAHRHSTVRAAYTCAAEEWTLVTAP